MFSFNDNEQIRKQFYAAQQADMDQNYDENNPIYVDYDHDHDYWFSTDYFGA